MTNINEMETENNPLISQGFVKTLLNKIFLSTQGMNYTLRGNNFNHAPRKNFRSYCNMRNCF